jgi:hypothetical protein
MKKDIPENLISKTIEWLGKEGKDFFTSVYKKYGKLNVVLEGFPPHPVHLREGMTVRNFMRESNLCEGWSDHDYDDNWEKLILLSLKLNDDQKRK